jgi:hypothetical protein
MEVQGRHIEKLTMHIKELKEAELDLAKSEMEGEKVRNAQVMQLHIKEINALKAEMGATFTDVEGMFQQKVDELEKSLQIVTEECKQKDSRIADMNKGVLEGLTEQEMVSEVSEQLKADNAKLLADNTGLKADNTQLQTTLATVTDQNGQVR